MKEYLNLINFPQFTLSKREISCKFTYPVTFFILPLTLSILKVFFGPRCYFHYLTEGRETLSSPKPINKKMLV